MILEFPGKKPQQNGGGGSGEKPHNVYVANVGCVARIERCALMHKLGGFAMTAWVARVDIARPEAVLLPGTKV